MSTLTVQTNPEVYSTIAHFNNAMKEYQLKNIPNYIESIGKVFAKYKACDDFGILSLHRHFDLSTEEILVDTYDNGLNMSLAVPWRLDETSARPIDAPSISELWHSYQLPKRSFVAPLSWCYVNTGEVAPFEFVSEDIGTPKIPSKDFVDELYTVLRNFGIEKHLGIRRIDYIRHVSSWETTPERVRANLTVLGERPKVLDGKRMIKVCWKFIDNGKVSTEGLYCYDHDTYCTHSD